jgi:chromosome partitioning protein
MKIIAIANQKGQAGKTATGVHLAYALAAAGNMVLFIDADPQASASLHFLGVKYKDLTATLFNAITSTRNVEKLTKIDPVIVKPNLHLLPAHDELEQAELLLTKPGFKYQYQLQKLLELYSGYDYVVIDTPGSRVSIFATLALVAAQFVIVPLRTSYDHYDATRGTLNLIEDVREGLNPHLRLFAIVPTQFESNVVDHQDVLALLQEEYKDVVFEPSRKTNKYGRALLLRSDIREVEPELGKYWDKLAAKIEAEGKVSA